MRPESLMKCVPSPRHEFNRYNTENEGLIDNKELDSLRNAQINYLSSEEGDIISDSSESLGSFRFNSEFDHSGLQFLL